MTIAKKLANAQVDYRVIMLRERGKMDVWLLVRPGERREEVLRLVHGEQVRYMPNGNLLVRAK